eukprot:m.474903 g.474903  ORF g.474903 m.474903 type:complete len:86 (+) comp37112_c0_seq1:114-371(+)
MTFMTQWVWAVTKGWVRWICAIDLPCTAHTGCGLHTHYPYRHHERQAKAEARRAGDIADAYNMHHFAIGADNSESSLQTRWCKSY